jgi:hypothetical protein
MATTAFKTFSSDLKSNIGASKSLNLLYLLLLVDLAFIVFHCIYGTWHYLKGTMDDVNRMFLISEDQSYAEYFQYVKEIGIAAILTVAGYKRKKLLYFSWALLFFYLFFDDAFSFHELAGHKVAKYFQFESVMNLRADDLGELFISAFFGILIFGLITISTFRTFKLITFSLDMFILMGLLIFFGVGVDMAHIIIDNKTIGYLFGIIEDGGEMVVMSLMLFYLFLVYKQLVSDKTFVSPIEVVHDWIRSFTKKIFNRSFY